MNDNKISKKTELPNKVIILGNNHQSTLGFVRCFGMAGIRPYCVLYASPKGLVFSSRYPQLKKYVNSPDDGLEFIIKEFSSEKIKPILLGSNDASASVIDKNLNRLKEKFYVSSAGKQGSIVRLMDKFNICKLAEKYGFFAPKTIVLSKHDVIPDDLKYPVFTKSRRTIDGGKHDEMICNNKDELQYAFSNLFNADCILVQEYIDKKQEFNYYGMAIDDNIFIPYINFRPRFSANALGGYHIFKRPQNLNQLSKVKELIRATNYNGLFSVEFLEGKDGKEYFMEINFRHDGDTVLLTPGINLPMAYCYALVNRFDEYKIGKLKPKIIGMREIVDFQQSVLTRQISLLKWLWQFVTADSYILWYRLDQKPFWEGLWAIIKHKVFKK